MPGTRGSLVNCCVCIAWAVAACKMRWLPRRPFWSWASMKLAISVAVALIAPAGAPGTASKGSGRYTPLVEVYPWERSAERLTGRAHPRGNMHSQPLAQRLQIAGRLCEGTSSPVFEPGGMGQQMGQGDRLGIGGRKVKRFEVGTDIGMQVHLALLGELHHSCPGEELTHRANPEEGRIGADQLAVLPIGITIALGEKQSTVLHHGDRCPRDMAICQLHAEHAIQKGLQLARIAEPGGRWWGRVPRLYRSHPQGGQKQAHEEDNREKSKADMLRSEGDTRKERHAALLLRIGT